MAEDKKEGRVVKRDAFIYLDPKSPEDKFAQCETCMMWTGPEHKICTILGKEVTVNAEDSCGLYVHGDPMPEEAEHAVKLVTPEEAGFLANTQVRCENCGSFDAGRSTCIAFEEINKALPEQFDLTSKVKAKGCCNAWHK